MSKAVLIIDMPYDCYACKIAANPHCIKLRNLTGNSGITGQRPQYCPLEPLVESIPIEWIEMWQSRHEWEYDTFFKMVNGVPKHAIECLLEDWKKENDKS